MTQVSTTLFRLNLDYFRKNFLNQKTWGEKHVIYENSTIRVIFHQYLINTADQQLLFQVIVKIIDPEYFVKTFGMSEKGLGREGDAAFSVPIDNKEYTDEVFVKRVYGAFKDAFSGSWGCLYRYKTTAVTVALENETEKLKTALKKEAKVIYKKEKAKGIKQYITEAVFSEYYIKENEFYKKLRDVCNGLENNAQDYLGEKDTKLFCDFLGLKYTPSSDIEKYKKYLEMAKELLK